ncbi:MAG TPA: MFS transporter [Candidatus Acidoferrum sp.]|nr:MFS transporter [Candidatus Acidoferrum sp.]
MMTKKGRRFKIACFTIQGSSSFAISFYFYYLYFLMQHRFGFGDKQNLALAALLGLIYVFASWQAGRFAQRCGYFTALKTGFGIMLLASAVGSQLHSAVGLILASLVLSIGQCCLWPAIEAVVSEGEDATGLPAAIGTYNVVWAGTNALALFTGGTLVEKFGYQSIFYLPFVIFAGQLALTFWLQNHAAEMARAAAGQAAAVLPPDPHRPSPAKTLAFRRMALLSNPFAYIAINTLIAVLPGIAAKFQLTPMQAGFACSLWGFARLGTFFALWFWTGWHYRFRWLAAAFVLLIFSFATMLVIPNLFVVLGAQIIFGVAIGLIYYSSLFYSMDASETKGEHGGIHEAAIGVGNFIGPAVGAASLQWVPQYANSSAVAVSVLLLFGLGALVAIWRTAK